MPLSTVVISEHPDSSEQLLTTHNDIYGSDDGQDLSHMEIEETDLEIKPITANEMFEQFGLSVDSQALIPKISPERYNRELTIAHRDNPMEMVLPAEEAFYAASAEISNLQNPDSDITPMSTTRGDRADAGDSAGEATQLKNGGNWTGDYCRTTYNSQNQQYTLVDVDWFYIVVEEKGNLETEYIQIYINNSAKKHASKPRNLVAMIFDPVSVLLSLDTYPIPGANQGKTISTADSEMSQRYLDLELFLPQENGTLNAAPPISGVFFIQIYCITQDVDIYYNITAVKKTVIKPVVTPYDMNNYPENSTVILKEGSELGKTVTGKVTQHKDHWDWYDISKFIDFHGATWPNKITYTVDITSEEFQTNSFYSWTEVWVLYQSTDGNTLYLNGDIIDSGGSMHVTSGGVPTEPISNNLEITCANAWIGIRVWSIGIDSQGQIFPQRYDGGSDYSLTFNVNLQNAEPLLYQGKIEPTQDYYYYDDDITFNVKYRDTDNNPPKYIRVTIDNVDYDMTSSGTNYVSGVTYKYTTKGGNLDKNTYPHYFNFSSNDGLVPITLTLSSPNNQFKVIEDQTPGIWDTAPKKISFEEDDEEYIMPLSQVFEDVDPIDGLAYSLKKDEGYGQKYEGESLDVYIHQNTKLRFVLKKDQHGIDEFTVRAVETLKQDPDEYTFSASHKINVSITPTKDVPFLNPIGKQEGYQGELLYFQISATDPDILTDDDELTFSTNRSDGKGPDDLENFMVIPDGIYGSTIKANISFTPNNYNVGTFLAKVTVKDKDGLEDSRDVEFVVHNDNDEPIIMEIAKGFQTIDTSDKKAIEMTAKEDEWFNISVVVKDIDIDIGEKNDILFKIQNHTFLDNVVLTHKGGTALTAEMGVLPTNVDVGINYINFSVHDGKGGSDELSIKIEVENTNDPPQIPQIIRPTETVFSIMDPILFEGYCDDDDLDVPGSEEQLTYKWFLKEGNLQNELKGSDPENIIRIEFPQPYLPYNDDKLLPGNYTIRLEVTDLEGEMQFVEYTIRLLNDFDNDFIPDDWEDKYDLDPHNREDAFNDPDKDGFDNLDEYNSRTNPRDPQSKPAGKSEAASDYTVVYIVVVIIVIIILIVLFMILRNRRKQKDELEAIENLAYPDEEEPKVDEMKPPMSPPIMGMGVPGKGPMPPFPPPPPGVPPAVFQMQYMKMMQQFQQQQQQRAGQQRQPGQGTQKSQTISQPPSQHNLQAPELTPKLPPANDKKKDNNLNDTDFGTEPSPITQGSSGRVSELDSMSDDDSEPIESEPDVELVPGKPEYLSEDQTKEMGITDSKEIMGNNTNNKKNNNMKCPNCGISVQSGWFLCPGCKSPLN